MKTSPVSVITDQTAANLAGADRRSIFVLLAGTVSAGDWVVTNATSTIGVGRAVVISPATTAEAFRVLGVAMKSGVAGDMIEVVTWGPVASANVVTAVATLTALTLSGAATGRAIAGTVGTDHIIGFTTSVAASNTASVFVKC